MAASATSTFRDASLHPFPTCFACGPDRAEGDGLRLFAGRVGDAAVFAAPWIPTEVDVPIVWAALDCPSSAPAFADPTVEGPFVLGRITARIDRLPTAGRAPRGDEHRPSAATAGSSTRSARSATPTAGCARSPARRGSSCARAVTAAVPLACRR